MKQLKTSVVSIMIVLVAVLTVSGCRGYRSSDEPIHLNPNFDWQPKVKAQTKPMPVPSGTVAWGDGHRGILDPHRSDNRSTEYVTGRNDTGSFVSTIPVSVNQAMMDRGQERFNIYCAVCHSQTGHLKTPVINRGFVPPPSLADPRLIGESDGYLFDVITNGVRTMPAYRKQVPVADRWAIVLYIRALQQSRNATMEDVPVSMRRLLK